MPRPHPSQQKGQEVIVTYCWYTTGGHMIKCCSIMWGHMIKCWSTMWGHMIKCWVSHADHMINIPQYFQQASKYFNMETFLVWAWAGKDFTDFEHLHSKMMILLQITLYSPFGQRLVLRAPETRERKNTNNNWRCFKASKCPEEW